MWGLLKYARLFYEGRLWKINLFGPNASSISVNDFPLTEPSCALPFNQWSSSVLGLHLENPFDISETCWRLQSTSDFISVWHNWFPLWVQSAKEVNKLIYCTPHSALWYMDYSAVAYMWAIKPGYTQQGGENLSLYPNSHHAYSLPTNISKTVKNIHFGRDNRKQGN